MGIRRMRRCTWARYISFTGIDILRHSDPIDWIETPTFYKHSFAFAKIDCLFVDAFQPRMAVTISKVEKKPFNFDAGAIAQ